MSEPDLTKQDEDIGADAFTIDETQDHHEFGNWPKVFGCVLTVFLLVVTFTFTG